MDLWIMETVETIQKHHHPPLTKKKVFEQQLCEINACFETAALRFLESGKMSVLSLREYVSAYTLSILSFKNTRLSRLGSS